MTCNQVFEGMAQKFQEFKIKDVNGVFQFNIDGDGGGRWTAVCRGSYCQVNRGMAIKPDVIISAKDKTVVKLAEGRLNPALAVLTRQVKIQGDMPLVAKMKKALSGLI